MKLKQILAISVASALLAGCSKASNTSNSNTQVSENALIIEPKETVAPDNSTTTVWNDDEGVICVLFGYGFNTDFYETALETLSKTVGLAENGGLVLPVLFPNDLHNRISNFYHFIDDYQLKGIILLGAPEDTHLTLARIHESYDNHPYFNIFSFFPQDDILGEEANCNFVLENEISREDEQQMGDREETVDPELMNVLVYAIKYMAQLPGALPADNELAGHIQHFIGSKKIRRYTDRDTGLRSVNHFVIEAN